MSPAHVLQPTYERLKRELMQGVWAQNVRLEAARIAEDYGVSATPVRDSLNMLAGEGLVTFRPGEGYRTNVVTEREITDLLGMNLVLLGIAIETAPPVKAIHDFQPHCQDDQYAQAVGTCFYQLALASGNRVLAELVARLNERLFQMRMKEPLVFENLDTELASLRESCSFRPAAAKQRFAIYHRRRIKMAGALASLLA